MSWDTIVLICILLLALLYVARRFQRARRGESCCSSGCGECSCAAGKGSAAGKPSTSGPQALQDLNAAQSSCSKCAARNK